MKSTEPILIIHDIRSAQNVGALFRTADAVGIKKIYLSSLCPLPIDRFGRPVGAIAKTALGAERSVPWEKYEDIAHLIQQLSDEGYRIIAIEQSHNSSDYKALFPASPYAFIVGNEVTGIPEELLTLVDTVVEIPMRGTKESLNVSVAAGIVLFRILDR